MLSFFILEVEDLHVVAQFCANVCSSVFLFIIFGVNFFRFMKMHLKILSDEDNENAKLSDIGATKGNKEVGRGVDAKERRSDM